MSESLSQSLDQLRRLAEDLARLLDTDPPRFLKETNPDLVAAKEWYTIGLLGGKEVGKSALVNALVGRTIAESSSHGPGTEQVLAYVHRDRLPEVRDSLERNVPGAYRTVVHEADHLRNQVLLDLPDIDSHYTDHLRIAQTMVEGMLYPVWIQSIEKYADRAPAELLQRVAQGNAAENFVFCLNKVDQVEGHGGKQAMEEIREDYAHRLKQRLGLSNSARVLMLSAHHPDRYDFPRFREVVGTQRDSKTVSYSRDLAGRRQARTLFEWIGTLRLEERLAKMNEFISTAETILFEKVGEKVLEQVIPAIEKDRTERAETIAEAQSLRVARWPLVRLLQAPFSSIGRLVHLRFGAPSLKGWFAAGAGIQDHLTGRGVGLTTSLETTFATLQGLSPTMFQKSDLPKYWREEVSRGAIEVLAARLGSIARNREKEIRRRYSKGGGPIGWLGRILLTVGALLWFPFGQPILATYLSPETEHPLPQLVVHLTGVPYLLQTLVFMALYFCLIWLALRWSTERGIDKLNERWNREENKEFSYSAVAMAWLADLLEPFRHHQDRLLELKHRIDELEKKIFHEH